MTNLLILSIGNRKQSALKVQEILTESGCMVKTRLGIHTNPSGVCMDAGVIILEVIAKEFELQGLVSKLETVEGVKAQLVKI